MNSIFRRNFYAWFFILSICLFASDAVAQTISSPYSSFGLGEIQSFGFGRSKGMGGTGIGLRLPNMLNISNPASYSAVGKQSFIFDAGVEYKHSHFETEKQAQLANGANLTHMAIAFPLLNNYWYTSVGLTPFSSVGYSVKTEGFKIGVGDMSSTYEGAGGVNRIYWGHSVQPIKGLSIGANISYLFGTIDNVRTSTIADEKTSSSLKWEENIVVRDLAFDYGVQYQHTVSDDFMFTLGAVLTHPKKIKATKKVLAVNNITIDGRQVVDYQRQLTDTLQFTESQSHNLEMPLQYGVGASVVLLQKIVFSGDYHIGKWSEVSAESLKNSNLLDSKSMNVGVEFVPNYRSLKYFDRVRYRAGARMSDTYWEIEGTQIKDMSLTLGLGLPLKRGGSMFDFAFEVGQRGTLDNALLKETYFKASLNFTLQDYWFIKRKFD